MAAGNPQPLYSNYQQAANTSPATKTIRPAGLDEAAPIPQPAEASSSAPEVAPEEAGMSRLMAAKRRAQQRQQEKDDA